VARDDNIVAKRRASDEFEMHLAGVRVRVRFYGVIGVGNEGRDATYCSEDSDGNAARAIQQRLQDGPQRLGGDLGGMHDEKPMESAAEVPLEESARWDRILQNRHSRHNVRERRRQHPVLTPPPGALCRENYDDDDGG
jgi:hypothetical protein